MPYTHYNPAVPDPADPPADGMMDARDNLQACMDGLVFSGLSTWKVSWVEQNADGTPATDPTIPDQYVGTAVSDANHKWKAVNTYGAGNRLEGVVFHRSYDAGASWLTIKTTTLTYDGGGNCVSCVDS